MSEAFTHRIALSDTLQAIHRAVAISVLQYMDGADISAWDEKVIRELPSEQTRHINHDVVRYDYPYVELPAPLLDATAIKLQSSLMPADIQRRIIVGNTDTVVEDAIKRHRTAARMLEFETMWGASLLEPAFKRQPGVWGEIFVLPDAPPFVIDGYHLKELMYTDDDGIPHWDSDLVPAVIDTFGPEAIEYVPENVCGTIVRALRNSRAYNRFLETPPSQQSA